MARNADLLLLEDGARLLLEDQTADIYGIILELSFPTDHVFRMGNRQSDGALIVSPTGWAVEEEG